MPTAKKVKETVKLIKLHYVAYTNVKPYAVKYSHPHPTDTRGWSQIIVSAITGIMGRGRKKGTDLVDGSDVKAANCWDAIDVPRFNGCVKAGTKAPNANSIRSLNNTPYLFFVLWDTTETTRLKRCRIWVVRTKHDREFRRVAKKWYRRYRAGDVSDNFQLHPPCNKACNTFTNNCGDLDYPLLFKAHIQHHRAKKIFYNPRTLRNGVCTIPNFNNRRMTT